MVWGSEMESCVCGYHIYQLVWTPTLDDEFICVRYPFNSIDRYAVAVKNDDTVVEYLPKRYQDSVLYSNREVAWPNPDAVLILLVTS